MCPHAQIADTCSLGLLRNPVVGIPGHAYAGFGPCPLYISAKENPVLDVHPPHEPVHGWRDFLLHIATITIGLLIALSLEAAVEYVHHRHLVHEARENIHREIERNQQLLAQNSASLRADTLRMQGNIIAIRQLRDHPRSSHGKLAFDLRWSSFAGSAWRTARDTEALAYMPYDELQDLSTLYAQQEYVNSLGTTLFTDQGKAPSIIASEATVEDLQLDQLAQLMARTTDLLSQLEALQQRLAELRQGYNEAAGREAH